MYYPCVIIVTTLQVQYSLNNQRYHNNDRHEICIRCTNISTTYISTYIIIIIIFQVLQNMHK